MLILRNLLFTAGYAGSALVFGTLSVLLLPLPYKWRAPLILAWISFVFFWLRVCCGVKIQVTRQDAGVDGPFVIIANHQSTLETLFLQRYFSNTATILKRQLLYLPFFGWGLAGLRPIPIDRGSPVKALKKVKLLGKRRIASGMNVLVFPEGTRRPPGQLGSFARSGADIAAASAVPIVPIAHNAGLHWPKGSWLKLPGVVHMVIGAPIASGDGNSKALTATARDWIDQTTRQLQSQDQHIQRDPKDQSALKKIAPA